MELDLEKKSFSRRQFLKGALALAVTLPILLRRGIARAAGKMISPEDPLAKALHYFPDASKAPASLRVDKMGVAAKDQTCTSCSFFKAAANLNGKPVGSCQLMPKPDEFVSATGWCASWVKKA